MFGHCPWPRAGRPRSRASTESLDRVGLAAVARRKAGGFSTGMSQRLALATALIGRPDLVDPRRADERPRPQRRRRRPRADRPVGRRRHHGLPLEPRPARGRAAVRPRRDPARGPDRGRGPDRRPARSRRTSVRPLRHAGRGGGGAGAPRPDAPRPTTASGARRTPRCSSRRPWRRRRAINRTLGEAGLYPAELTAAAPIARGCVPRAHLRPRSGARPPDADRAAAGRPRHARRGLDDRSAAATR